MEYHNDFDGKIYKENPDMLILLIALIVIVFLIAVFLYYRTTKSVANTILLTGIGGTGKTLIYARLLTSRHVHTYSSLKANVGYLPIGKHVLRIVDIPGHRRVRRNYFHKYEPFVRGIVYVIDSMTIQQDIKEVAEYLYDLLSDIHKLKDVPLLIFCNKQDQDMAKGFELIQSLLENEINILRRTKSNQLEDITASIPHVFLGKVNQEFSFAHLNTKVKFVEGCAIYRNSPFANIEELNKWLHSVTK